MKKKIIISFLMAIIAINISAQQKKRTEAPPATRVNLMTSSAANANAMAPSATTNALPADLPDSKHFHENITTGKGNPSSGFIDLYVYKNGNWTARTNIHNSGAVGFKYQLVVTNLARNGFLFTLDHAGSCDGTDKVRKIRRDDTWDASGNSTAIANNYEDVLQGALKWKLSQETDILSVFTAFAMPLNPVAVVKLTGNLAVKSTELLFDGTKKITGIIVNSLGQITLQVSMTTYDLFAYGHLPKYRQLTAVEYNWANKFYNGKLPSLQQIIITNLMSVDRRAFTVPNGNGITVMNLGDAFNNPMQFTNAGYPVPGQVFIHELAHVWQIQNSSQLKAFGEGVSNQWKNTILGHDVYAYTCGQPWDKYNYEQQAHIVDICFKNRNGQLTSPDNSCELKYVVDNIRGVSFPQ